MEVFNWFYNFTGKINLFWQGVGLHKCEPIRITYNIRNCRFLSRCGRKFKWHSFLHGHRAGQNNSLPFWRLEFSVAYHYTLLYCSVSTPHSCPCDVTSGDNIYNCTSWNISVATILLKQYLSHRWASSSIILPQSLS